MTRHSAAVIREALAYLSPDLPRDEWVRIGMAIKSELGEAGFALFDEWSALSDAYDARAALSTWKSIREDGAVTAGTLFALAKAAGFVFDRGDRRKPKDSAELARLEQERADRAAAAAAERAQRQLAAKAIANERWAGASPDGRSGYLARKGVRAHGVRFSKRALLVPLADLEGEIWSLQAIADDGEKQFLPGGRVAGLLHWIGDPATGEAILACEGYATGATLHEVTGWPVAVAFNVGNLARVTEAVRQRHPDRPMIVAADDDRETAERTGRNPGVEGARAAAAHARAAVAIPEGLVAGDGTDFNDLARAQGAEAVLSAIRAALAAAHEALAERATDPAPRQQDAATGSEPAAGARTADSNQGPEDRFSVTATGVWYQDMNRQEVNWVHVCSPLTVTAITRDSADGAYGYLLEFENREGKTKRWPIHARLFSGDGTEYRSILLDQGIHLSPNKRARELLGIYIQTRRPGKFMRCVDRLGWHDELGVYVWPDRSFGDGPEEVIYQPEERVRTPYRQAGTLEEWRSHVASLCVGNPRLVFSVACAFAGPCLRLVGLEGGGFHLRGNSGGGKSSALHVAGSVYGGGDFVRTWRSTSNAMEGVASERCDSLLPLDEISEASAADIGATVYMLANGQEKSRKTRVNLMRPARSWLVLFLSSGEKSLAALMGEAGQAPRAGQEVRLVELQADAGVPDAFVPGKTMGVFEDLHGLEMSQEGGAMFARLLRDGAGRHFGTAGESFLDLLASDRERCTAGLKRRMGELVKAWLPGRDAGGQVRRVADRFALVAAAGELASEAGITGWGRGEAARAAQILFKAWLAERGSDGAGEEIAIIRQVARVLTERGEANFPWWHRAGDDHRPNATTRWGLRRLIDKDGAKIESNSDFYANYGEKMTPELAAASTSEFFFLLAPFRAEAAKGYEPHHVADVLYKRGHLIPETVGGRLDRKERLPTIGSVRCYRIKPTIFGDELL